MKTKILKKIAKGEISPTAGYELLYKQKKSKARFVKLHMAIDEHPCVSGLINALFFLPFPISIVERILLRAINNKGANIDYQTFKDLLNYSYGTEIHVITDEAKIRIDIF
ncbi:MAG: hypothetical protein AB7V00_02070 [Bacilli bacterium]